MNSEIGPNRDQGAIPPQTLTALAGAKGANMKGYFKIALIVLIVVIAINTVPALRSLARVDG